MTHLLGTPRLEDLQQYFLTSAFQKVQLLRVVHRFDNGLHNVWQTPIPLVRCRINYTELHFDLWFNRELYVKFICIHFGYTVGSCVLNNVSEWKDHAVGYTKIVCIVHHTIVWDTQSPLIVLNLQHFAELRQLFVVELHDQATRFNTDLGCKPLNRCIGATTSLLVHHGTIARHGCIQATHTSNRGIHVVFLDGQLLHLL